MNEKETLTKRVNELAQRAYQNGYVTHTQFLMAAEQTDFLETAGVPRASSRELHGSYHGTEWVLYGGWEEAERKTLCFLPDYLDAESFLMGEQSEPQVVACMEVKAVNRRFAEELTHRDYLGALMNLGIERDRIGDILVAGREQTNAAAIPDGQTDGTDMRNGQRDVVDIQKSKSENKNSGDREGTRGSQNDAMAYLFVMKENAELIASELIRIRHTSVTCREVPAAACTIRPEYEEREGSVSSERLDAILAMVYHLSRGKAQELVEAEQVFVDGRTAYSGGYDLKPGSRVSVRGHGKFQYLGTGTQTKKGRYYAKVKIWK
jgi:RNA-binding protein YlmH